MNDGLDMAESVPSSPSIVSGPCATAVAPAPFDDPSSDIILRTSDHVEFRVLKVILGLASPVFKDMFSLPQPAIKGEGSAEIPIIPIAESSAPLDAVLRFCYPVVAPELDDSDISLIGGVLAAALKYDINAAIEPARKALRSRAEATDKDAVAAYAIACSLRQEDDARVAAVACLKWPFPGPGTKVPQLTLISGLDHYNLLDFHRRAGEAVVSLFKNNCYEFDAVACAEITPDIHHCSGSQIKGSEQRLVREYQWWTSSKSALSDAFKLAPLDTAKLSMSTLATALMACTCHMCKEMALRGWDQAREAIISAMKAKIEEVELELSWVMSSTSSMEDGSKSANLLS